MRLVTTFTLLLAPATLAQPCDPEQSSEPCPDTTAAHRYFPLAVGNQWQYYQPPSEGPAEHWSWRITGETEIGGQTYVELVRCDEVGGGSADCAAPVPIRYAAEHAMIVRRDGDEEWWWNELPCRLDGDFNGEAACTGPGAESLTAPVLEGAYGATVEVPPDEVSGDTRKRFGGLGGAPGFETELYAGLGATEFRYDLVENPTRLVHADISGEEPYLGGEQVGTPAFATCDPSEPDGIPCPDTTDWKRYFPLEVGNRWQYVRDVFFEDDDDHYGVEVLGTEEIEGVEHFRLHECERTEVNVTCGESFLVRYDEAIRAVLRRDQSGETPSYSPYSSDLGRAFWDTESVSGEYGFSFDLGSGPTVEGTRKNYFYVAGGEEYVSGIGPVLYTIEASPDEDRLLYARIGGETYGSPAFVFPTADEPGASAPAAFALRSVYPNPAREAATVAFSLNWAQEVTLEVLDVLGRVVLTQEVGPQAAGPHEARLNTDVLPSGLYLVRLRGDGAEIRRLVVLR